MSPLTIERLKLFLLLMSAGFAVLGVHDYAYRRADVTGTGDYEFGGLVSHAGTDILIVALLLSVVAALSIKSARGRHRS